LVEQNAPSLAVTRCVSGIRSGCFGLGDDRLKTVGQNTESVIWKN